MNSVMTKRVSMRRSRADGYAEAGDALRPGEPQPLHARLAVLFDVVDALSRDGEIRAVGARQELLLIQIPDGEFEVLARAAGQLLELHQRETGIALFGTAPGVEDLEHHVANVLFQLEVVVDRGTAGGKTPALLAHGLVADVILRPLFWIVQRQVGLMQKAKAAVVASLLIVRMESLRQ